MHQYVLLAALLIPVYLINEWLVLDGGLGITRGFVDSAGSIVIHAFGAYFGLGLALTLTRKSHRQQPIQADETSDRFSMLGSMVLWVFWPSFCSAVVPSAEMPRTVLATVLALCGSTLSTFVVSSILRKGKPSFADMANAALAGGVAVGATCNRIAPAGAFAGVHNLHGMPGLLGGLTATLVVPGIATAQLAGLGFTVVFAFGCGSVGGYLIKLLGEKLAIYQDHDEFFSAEPASDDDDGATLSGSPSPSPS